LNPEPTTVTKPANTDEQWAAYLQQKGLVRWAQNNPQMAEKLRQRTFPSTAP
jgi:hypothetical protein